MSEPAAEGVVSAGAELTEEEPAEAELPADTVPFSAAALGETPIGDAPALGYVLVRDDGERQFAQITDAGRAWLLAAHPPAGA